MNKIIVSVVFAIFLVFGINKIADVIFYVEKPEKSVYQVASLSNAANTKTTETTSENSETESVMMLFASTSADSGEKIFKKCGACHSISKGGGNKIGPALWGVLGRKAGSISDYKYSKAMVAFEKHWSVEEMDGFLTKPREWIKGTKMSFSGLKKAEDRAAVILYMNKNTDNSLPLQ